MSGGIDIELAGEPVRLLSQHALYWPAGRSLMVADLHLGKDYAFGRHGIAIPAGSNEATLRRLDVALHDCGATGVFVLGDLVHAAPQRGESWLEALGAFLDRHRTLEVTVIAGNHDQRTDRTRLDARLRWCDQPLPVGPFLLQHEPPGPRTAERRYIIAGHLHPVYHLRGKGSEPGVRLPVFHVRPNCTVLPSLGTFTGGKTVRPGKSDRLYAVTGNAVRAVPLNKETGHVETQAITR